MYIIFNRMVNLVHVLYRFNQEHVECDKNNSVILIRSIQFNYNNKILL